MSVPISYVFLDADGEQVDHTHSTRFVTFPPRDEAGLKKESILALGKYIGFHHEGRVTEEEIRSVAFVKIANAEPIRLDDILEYARQSKTLLEKHVQMIATIYPEILLDTPPQKIEPTSDEPSP